MVAVDSKFCLQFHANRTGYYFILSESTDSEESSSDSDCDIRKQWKENRGKRKVVNIVGSKIVQIGRSNKVVESSNSYSDDFENPHLLETKYEQVGTKSR
jgi:hypothetical protein